MSSPRCVAAVVVLVIGLQAWAATASSARPKPKARRVATPEAPPSAPTEEASNEGQIRCFVVREKDAPVEALEFTYDGDLQPKEVEVEIHACGLSRADVQMLSDEDTAFPAVPGQEVVGVVVKAGRAVSSVRPGQRVGIGLHMGDVHGGVVMSDAPVQVGGLANRIRVRSRWSFPIPESLPTEQAAPLLGAGAIAWSHISRSKLKRGSKVGVIGLRGIGHLASQFAAQLGHSVTIIGDEADGRHAKEDGTQLGSSAFVALTDPAALKEFRQRFDLILCTLDAGDLKDLGVRWADCLRLLKSDATFCIACESAQEVNFPMKALNERRLSLQTSAALSRNEAKEMLRFCER